MLNVEFLTQQSNFRNIETRARQTSLSKQENPSVKISRETGEYFANFSNHNYLLPVSPTKNVFLRILFFLKEISIRNGRIASLIFFALIVTFFRNHSKFPCNETIFQFKPLFSAGSTKKVQQYDAYVILYGLFKVVEMTGLRNHFNMISSLFLNDSNVLSATNAKHTRLAMSLLKASAVIYHPLYPLIIPKNGEEVEPNPIHPDLGTNSDSKVLLISGDSLSFECFSTKKIQQFFLQIQLNCAYFVKCVIF